MSELLCPDCGGKLWATSNIRGLEYYCYEQKCGWSGDMKDATIAALRSELDKLREQTRWIPVGDDPANYCFHEYHDHYCDLAPDMGRFWVEYYVDDRELTYFGEAIYRYDTGKWIMPLADPQEINVIRYCQLPQPPEEV